MLAALLVLAAGCHPLAVPRSGHTTTPLPDGGVLVVGGGNSYPATDRVGRYLPRHGRWRSVARLPVALEAHTASALLDGRVLVTGGYGPDVEHRAEALVYDPRTDRWSTVAPMSHARAYHLATPLLDGRVLVVGGHQSGATPELYDPRRDAWSPAAEPPSSFADATLTLLRDGRVLLVGDTASFVYDPREDHWHVTGPVLQPRGQHTATLLPDGRVLAIGGRSFAEGGLSGEALASSEIYEPRRDRWVPGPRLAEARSSHTATLVGGVLVIVGGMPSGWGGERALRSAEVLELRHGRWSVRTIGRNRTDHTATALPDGRLLLVGGRTELIVSKWNMRWSRTLRLRDDAGRAARHELTGALDPDLGAQGDRAP